MSKGHHPFGGSSLERRARCPGSYRMEHDLPERTSEDAQRGTRIHAAVGNDDAFQALVPEEAEVAAGCREFLNGFDDVEWSHEVELEVIDHGPFHSVALSWGTADAVGIGNELHVVDFKTGREEVPAASDNLQMAFYAAGAMARYNADHCHAHVFQPAINHVSHHEFRDLAGIVSTIKKIIERATQSGALELSDGSHCKYCRALGVCNAVAVSQNRLATDGMMITPENAGRVYDIIALGEKMLEGKRKELKMVVEEAGGEVPGLRFKTRQGNRQAVDLQQAHDAIADVISFEEFLTRCEVKIGRLETDYAAKLVDQGQARTLKDGKAIFASRVEMKRGRPTKYLARTKSD